MNVTLVLNTPFLVITIIVIFLLNVCNVCSTSITLKIYTLPQLMTYCLITNITQRPFVIDTEANVTVILNENINTLGNPIPIRNTNITFRKQSMNAREYTINWGLFGPYDNTFPLNNFNFFLIHNDSMFFGFSSLPFAHSFTDHKYSIIHNLYNNNIITTKRFSIWKPPLTYYDHLLFIGDVPSNYTNSTLYNEYTFNIKPNALYWESSNFESFIISTSPTINATYTNQYPLIFSINSQVIYVPPDMYRIIIDNYLHSFIYEGLCSKGGSTIECQCSYIKYLGNITLVFNNIQLHLTSSDLFVQSEEFECFFIIYENKDKQVNHNTWMIGMSGVLWEHLITFDHDVHQVKIYSSNKHGRYTYIPNSSVNIHSTQIKQLCIYVIVLLLIFTIYLIYKRIS